MTEPIGRDDVLEISRTALETEGAEAVEVLFAHEWGGLTRFADSSIHQSTWREDTLLKVRVVNDGRVGVATTNDFSKEGAARAGRDALELAQTAGPDPLFPGLAPRSEPPRKPDGYDEATARMTPEERAEAVATLVAQCGDGFHAAGAYETTASEVAVVNTEGQTCYDTSTQATLTTVASGGESGAGFAEIIAGKVADVDPEGIGRRAFEKARASQRPRCRCRLTG